MRYFGFAIADGMFTGDCVIRRAAVTDVRPFFSAEVVSCCNPSHTATLAAACARYGIDLPVPPIPSKVILRPGDEILVMGVRGLPRLTDRHEYTEAEVAGATFEFAHYQIVG